MMFDTMAGWGRPANGDASSNLGPRDGGGTMRGRIIAGLAGALAALLFVVG
jgi:hypothetical protein